MPFDVVEGPVPESSSNNMEVIATYWQQSNRAVFKEGVLRHSTLR